MMQDFLEGEELLIIEGDHEGKIAKFLHYSRDSGYLVPFAELPDGNIIKPWDREVVSERLLKEQKEELTKRIENLDEILKRFPTE